MIEKNIEKTKKALDLESFEFGPIDYSDASSIFRYPEESKEKKVEQP